MLLLALTRLIAHGGPQHQDEFRTNAPMPNRYFLFAFENASVDDVEDGLPGMTGDGPFRH